MELGKPGTKLRAVQEAMSEGRWSDAIRTAAKFPRLGDEERAIKRAASAIETPEFVRELRRDPDEDIEEGKRALRRRFEPTKEGE